MEARLGRDLSAGRVVNGPRPIDLDVLFLGRERVDHERLKVPHPRIGERPFVLVPLLDVAPGVVEEHFPTRLGTRDRCALGCPFAPTRHSLFPAPQAGSGTL